MVQLELVDGGAHAAQPGAGSDAVPSFRQDSGVTEQMSLEKSALEAEIAELKKLQAANRGDAGNGKKSAFEADLAELKRLQVANHDGDGDGAATPTPARPAPQHRPDKPPGFTPPAAAVPPAPAAPVAVAVASAGPCTWEAFDVNTGHWTQLQPDSETVVEAAFRSQQPSATLGGAGGACGGLAGPRVFEVEGDNGWFPLDAKTNSNIVQCLASQQRVLPTGFNRQIDTVAWTQTRTDTGRVRTVREIAAPSIVFDLNAGTVRSPSTNATQRIQRVARPMIYEFQEEERARWVRFLPHAEAIIEAAREKDLASKLQVNVVPSGRPVMYLIDLEKLEQQNCKTKFCRKIRRRIDPATTNTTATGATKPEQPRRQVTTETAVAAKESSSWFSLSTVVSVAAAGLAVGVALLVDDKKGGKKKGR